MCWECHKNLSNDFVKKDLQNAIKNPQFEKWNETSISHLTIAASGYNGEECKKLAIELLQRFEKWNINNKP